MPTREKVILAHHPSIITYINIIPYPWEQTAWSGLIPSCTVFHLRFNPWVEATCME